jgi:hypothetical protein
VSRKIAGQTAELFLLSAMGFPVKMKQMGGGKMARNACGS